MQLVSQMGEERTGYGAQRTSRVGLGGTIAVHAVVIGAFLLMPKEMIKIIQPPIFKTYPVPAEKDPPPVHEKAEKKETPQKPVPQDPFVPERTVDTSKDGGVVISTGSAGGDIGPIDPPRPADPPKPVPVLVEPTTDPRYASLFQPDYPAAMIRQELEGKVTVRVQINTEGRVTAVEKLFATNDNFWQVTQAQALRKWRFRPATRDGVPVEGTRTMTVHFKLDSQ